MRLSERVLLSLSRRPSDDDLEAGVPDRSHQDALNSLERVYPHFNAIVRGKIVVDYGCGEGFQSLALARRGAKRVVGFDTHAPSIARATQMNPQAGEESAVVFTTALDPALAGCVDVVISKDSMEHFGDPARELAEMLALLRPGGVLLLTFGPPWYAPYGSHMHFFTRMPWVNVIFSERTIMAVRARFRSDGARRYEEVECGLNQMSMRKFEGLIRGCGAQVRFRRYECVKRMQVLGYIPIIRELFINHVSVILSRD